MAYEYTRVTQVFTLSQVPACWVYPVSILIHAYGQEMAIPPNFPDEDTLASSQGLYYTELVPGRDY